MKKFAVLFIAFFIISNCFAQDAMQSFFGVKKPYTQKLGDLASITFIDTPKAKPSKGNEVYTYAYLGRLYLAQVSEGKKNLADRLTSGINDTVYNSYINGILHDLNGKLFYRKDTTIAGLPGVAFAYKGLVDSTTYYNYHYVSYFNEKILGFTVWSPDSLAWKDDKISSFFNSFKLSKNGRQIRDREVADANINVGHIILVSGSIIGGIILILVIILLIRKKMERA